MVTPQNLQGPVITEKLRTADALIDLNQVECRTGISISEASEILTI